MATELSRRKMLLMTALSAAAFTPAARLLAQGTRAVDAGPLASFKQDGVYPGFERQGFYIVRQGDRVFAQASLCTHKRSVLVAQPDGFVCKSHGSAFALDGQVQRRPAVERLGRYGVSVSESGNLLVDLARPLKAAEFDSPSAYVTVTS